MSTQSVVSQTRREQIAGWQPLHPSSQEDLPTRSNRQTPIFPGDGTKSGKEGDRGNSGNKLYTDSPHPKWWQRPEIQIDIENFSDREKPPPRNWKKNRGGNIKVDREEGRYENTKKYPIWPCQIKWSRRKADLYHFLRACVTTKTCMSSVPGLSPLSKLGHQGLVCVFLPFETLWFLTSTRGSEHIDSCVRTAFIYQGRAYLNTLK